MSAWDLIYQSIMEGTPVGGGTFKKAFRFAPDAPEGFQDYGLTVVRQSTAFGDGPTPGLEGTPPISDPLRTPRQTATKPRDLDYRHMLRQLGGTSALAGTLELTYFDTRKTLFGQSQAGTVPVEGSDMKHSAISIVRWAEGKSLLTLFNSEEAKSWKTLNAMGQDAYTHLMQQLRLASETLNAADLGNGGNIIVGNDPDRFTIIDTAHRPNQPKRVQGCNRPEMLISLFFPNYETDRAGNTDRAQVMDKLLEGARRAGMGARGDYKQNTTIEDALRYCKDGSYNGKRFRFRTGLTEDEIARVATELLAIPAPTVPEAKGELILPPPLSEIARFSLHKGEKALLSWLHDIAEAKVGRDIPQM